MKKKYLITNSGEDYTEIVVYLTDQEADLITKIADELNSNGSYSYCPTLQVEEFLGVDKRLN